MAIPLLIPFLAKAAFWTAGAVGMTVGAVAFTKNSERRYFNNGVCQKCGGHFKMIKGTEQKGNKAYKCDVCDSVVWIIFGTDDGYKYTPSRRAKS